MREEKRLGSEKVIGLKGLKLFEGFCYLHLSYFLNIPSSYIVFPKLP